MKYTAMGLLAAALAGCALTPSQVRETGSAYSAASVNQPTQVAACVRRKAENLSGTTVADIRPGEHARAVEVIIRTIGEAAGTVAVLDIRETSTGSTIAVRVTPNMLSNAEAWARRIVDGC